MDTNERDASKNVGVTIALMIISLVALIIVSVFDWNLCWNGFKVSVLQLIVLVAGAISYFVGKNRFNVACLALSSLLLALTILQLVALLIPLFEKEMEEIVLFIEKTPKYLAAIIISVVVLILTIVNITINRCQYLPPVVVEEVKPSSLLEIELNELNRLFNMRVISEPEYKRMRATIISRHSR